jgi:hypothetical protein
MFIPTHLKQLGVALPSLPKGESRLIVAQNGMFCERSGPFYKSCTSIEQTALPLESHDEYCTLTCGRIPRVMHRAMLGFFREAHQIHGGEAALVLLYHLQDGRFRWHCPPQTVEVTWSLGRWVVSDSIEFQNPLSLPPGWIHLGDAHLHPGAAYPSAIDVLDDQDGLHIIVGNVLTRPTYHVDFVMDGRRFSLTPSQIFDDPDAKPFARAPHDWLQTIKLRKRTSYTAGRPNKPWRQA